MIGCDKTVTTNMDFVCEILEKSVKRAGLNLLDVYRYKYKPNGLSCVAIVGESHISIHTWPEYDYVAIDVFVYSNTAWKVLEFVKSEIKPVSVNVVELTRGEKIRFSSPSWCVAGLSQNSDIVFMADKVLYDEKSKYQRIRILSHVYFGKMLVLDDDVQLTTRDEHIYHDALVTKALNLHRTPKTVAILGGGDGGALREVLKNKKVSKVYLVEIDKGVIEASKKYLREVHKNSFNDRRVELVIKDAFEFLRSGTTFDVVFFDLTDPDCGESRLLYTKQAFGLVKKCLNKGGIVSVNCGSSYFTYGISSSTIKKRLKSVFKYIFQHDAWIPSFGSPWSFAIASYDNTILRQLTK